MGFTGKLLDALATVIRMNDKVESMAKTIARQQEKIEQLNGRVIRLETAIEFALSARGIPESSQRARLIAQENEE